MKLNKRVNSVALAATAAGALFVTACSSGGGSQDGTVTAEWEAFCVATFDQDHTVVDVFGDVLFTARAGESYLMADWSDAFGSFRADLLFLTDDGPNGFEVEADAQGAFPFSSNCQPEATQPHYAVFNDVAVFETADLENKICDLVAGDSVSVETGSTGSSSVSGPDLSGTQGGPLVYEIELNRFSDQCGGALQGFVSVPETRALGATTWLVPVRRIIGPE